MVHGLTRMHRFTRNHALREKSSFHTKETYRKPAGNAGFTRGFPLVSIPATPSFPVVSIPWKALTAQIPEWKPRGNHWKPEVSNRKPRGNHWKPGVARQETPWKPGVATQETTWKPLETWGCQRGNYQETWSKLDGKYRFPLRKPYVNYLPTIVVALIVHKYCIGLTFF